MKQYVTALKMFFVLGVTWIVEVINYVLGWKYDHCWDSLSTLTVVSDQKLIKKTLIKHLLK